MENSLDPAKARETQEAMAILAKDIQAHLPEGWGYFVLVTPFDKDGGRANYCSNMERKSVFATMKEFLIRHSQGEDWMKHCD